MQRLVLIFTALLAITACSQKGGITLTAPDERGATEVKELKNVDDKTIRYFTKFQAARFLCDNQSFRHNEQRLIANLPPTITYFNSVTGKMEIAKIPPGQSTKIYDSKTPPFDMVACLAEANSAPWSKLASLFIKELGLPLVKYAAGFGIARNLIDALGRPTVSGENNRTVFGDNSTLNEAGGIPIENGIDASTLTVAPAENTEGQDVQSTTTTVTPSSN